MEIPKEELIGRVQSIVSRKILYTDHPESVNDQILSNLDSIGRLTLLVELENDIGVELMVPDLGPEVFSSFDALTEFVMSRI